MKHLLSHRFIYHAAMPAPDASGSQREAIAHVRQKLSGGEYTLRHYGCPCGVHPNDVTIAEVDRYGLPLTTVVCMSCGGLRIDPYLDPSAYEDFYTRYYQDMYARALDLNSHFAQQQAYGTKILSAVAEYLPRDGWVFEVGCGAGGALKVFQEHGHRVAGCDYSARLVAAAKENGIEHAWQGTLNDISGELAGVKANLIYLHHVFEHLNDPLDFLVNSQQYLNKGGRIVLVVPDVSRIEKFPNPNGDLLVFLHIAHKFNFSVAGMRRLAKRAGYVAQVFQPDPVIETTGSTMPELWLELRADGGESAELEKTANELLGKEMVEYLAKTERLYLRGLRRNQFRAHLKRLVPRTILRKLRSPA